MKMLSSKERLLRAINLEETDRIPLWLKFFERSYLLDPNAQWRNQFERVDQLLTLGLDDAVGISPPLAINKDVKIRKWKEIEPGEKYPVIAKEYETPRGFLRQVVRQTPDRPHPDDAHIFDDYNVPSARTKKYLVEDMNDLDALSLLFSQPNDDELSRFRNHTEQVKKFAMEKEVIVEGSGPMLGDAAVWLCGVNKVILATLKEPEFLRRLLSIVHEWDMMQIRLLGEVGGVDVIFHRGWYESTVFWSPKAYRTYLAPLIREEIELVHKVGAKFGYIMTREMTPLLEVFKEIGIDIIFGPDPVEGRCDLHQMKTEVRDHICLWGGVNSAVTLEFGTKKEIKKAVAEAIRTLAPGGGFILGPIDCIYGRTAGTRETPPSSIGYIIEAWRELREYPSSP